MSTEAARLGRIEDKLDETREIVVEFKATVEAYMRNTGDIVAGHERRLGVLETDIIRNGETRLRALEDAQTEQKGASKGVRWTIGALKVAGTALGAGTLLKLIQSF